MKTFIMTENRIVVSFIQVPTPSLEEQIHPRILLFPYFKKKLFNFKGEQTARISVKVIHSFSIERSIRFLSLL